MDSIKQKAGNIKEQINLKEEVFGVGEAVGRTKVFQRKKGLNWDTDVAQEQYMQGIVITSPVQNGGSQG